jgi:hypothetical protein
VVLETGGKALATRIAGEWIFWKSGNVDFLMITMDAERLLIVAGGGGAIAFLIGGLAGWRLTRRSRPKA